MSPAAKEMTQAGPIPFNREAQLMAQVCAGTITAHAAAHSLTPMYMDRTESGVKKIEQVALEDFEFYRDLVQHERHHDKNVMLRTAKHLRVIWDRE